MFITSLKLFVLLMQICSLYAEVDTSGCFYTADECPNENITFWFYAPDAPPEQIDPLNLITNQLVYENPKAMYIIIHGYTGGRDEVPNNEIREPLLQKDRYVVSVDYAAIAQVPCYQPWAYNNARIVAKCVAQFYDNLIDTTEYTSETINFIGFGMGAHIAGFVSSYVKTPLKRITGLDPFGRDFYTDNLDDKLDAGDADFVDAIHTDPYFRGINVESGHADFFVNSEKYHQPGCDFIENGVLSKCSHNRAAVYYAESITTNSGFVGISNDSNSTAIMGFGVSKDASGYYNVETNASPPYEKNQ